MRYFKLVFPTMFALALWSGGEAMAAEIREAPECCSGEALCTNAGVNQSRCVCANGAAAALCYCKNVGFGPAGGCDNYYACGNTLAECDAIIDGGPCDAPPYTTSCQGQSDAGTCSLGGATPPAATCSDGIQNQGETGVDCGGPCAACACQPNGYSWNRGGLPILIDEIFPTTICCSEEAFCYAGTTICECGAGSGPGPGGSVCGDGTQEVGEACDLGIIGNGPCPRTCSTLCQTNTCAPTETCFDGIQNQGETGVDCGGPCAACAAAPTCFDGIQNQGETGIDCGGPCPACGLPVVEYGCNFRGNCVQMVGGGYTEPTCNFECSTGGPIE